MVTSNANAAARRANRRPLSRQRVLDAAMTLADERGLEALTMRGLARTLGVEPMSLYHYAASRDEVVDAILARVVDQIELPSSDGDWRSAVRACAISANDVLRRHPWACNPLMNAPRVLPQRLRMVDALLGRIEDARLPAQLTDLAYHAIDSHILGFTLWQAGYSSGPPLSGEELQAFLRTIDIASYPHLQEHVAFHLAPRTPRDPTAFEFGLDLILDGVERMRDAWPPAPYHPEP